MLIGIVPLLILLIAPTLQIVWLLRRIKNKTKSSAGLITMLMMALCIFLSVIATFTSMYGFSMSGIRCQTGAIGFLALGGILSLIIIPVIGIIGGIIYYHTHKKKDLNAGDDKLSKEQRIQRIQKITSSSLTDLSNFKFDRDEANNYDEAD